MNRKQKYNLTFKWNMLLNNINYKKCKTSCKFMSYVSFTKIKIKIQKENQTAA